MTLRPGASQQLLEEIEQYAGFQFPADYGAFMLVSNGAEGPIGNSGYLHVYPLEELPATHEAYEIGESTPGLFLFATNLGGTAYAFDIREGDVRIVDLPFIPLDRDFVTVCADTFVGFLEHQSRE